MKIKIEPYYAKLDLSNKRKTKKIFGFPIIRLLGGAEILMTKYDSKGNPFKDYYTVDLYKLANTDKIGLLYKYNNQWLKSFRTIEELKEDRFVNAALCKNCNTVMWSMHRHDSSHCMCENDSYIDGGRSYVITGGMDMSKIEIVRLDLITGKVVCE